MAYGFWLDSPAIASPVFFVACQTRFDTHLVPSQVVSVKYFPPSYAWPATFSVTFTALLPNFWVFEAPTLAAFSPASADFARPSVTMTLVFVAVETVTSFVFPATAGTLA